MKRIFNFQKGESSVARFHRVEKEINTHMKLNCGSRANNRFHFELASNEGAFTKYLLRYKLAAIGNERPLSGSNARKTRETAVIAKFCKN